MPFVNEMHPYTREDALRLTPNVKGVYGIFRGDKAVYIGSGDIGERLLAHLNGDNPCIISNTPDLWTGEIFAGDPTVREEELILSYDPICNRVIPNWTER